MESSELEKLAEAVLGRVFVPLEASGRHVHVTAEQTGMLFGHPLTPDRPLSQPGQYLANERLTPEVTLYLNVVIDVLSQLAYVILGQVANADVGIYAGSSENVFSGLAADTVDVGQADLNPLVSWQVNARNTCH